MPFSKCGAVGGRMLLPDAPSIDRHLGLSPLRKSTAPSSRRDPNRRRSLNMAHNACIMPGISIRQRHSSCFVPCLWLGWFILGGWSTGVLEHAHGRCPCGCIFRAEL